MRTRLSPFNVTILNPASDVFYGLREITSLSMFDTVTGDFSDTGLFSTEIFGRQGEKSRSNTMAYIDLKVTVFHPLYFQELTALKGLYGEIILGRAYATWDEKLKDFVSAPVLQGETGFHFFLKYFDKIKFNRNNSKKRDKRIDFVEKFKPIALMQKAVVIPAGMRDIEYDDNGRPVEDEINEYYKKLISNANVINPASAEDAPETLDRARATIQRSLIALYDYIFNIVAGKRGFLMSNVASTTVAGTTRNVISSMETGSIILGDKRQPTLDTIFVGLPQFISGVRPVLIHSIKTGPFQDVFNSDGGNITLINKKTLEPEQVNLKAKTASNWLTKDGLQSRFASFLEPHIRHEPIELDDHYLGLIYQDEKSFKIFRDVRELPENLSKDKVRPITYAEFYYYHCNDIVDRIAHFATRYPVTESESIKEGVPYLKTTVESLQLTELGDTWEDTGKEYLEFPDTVRKVKFLETQAVHPSGLSSWGADRIQDNIY